MRRPMRLGPLRLLLTALAVVLGVLSMHAVSGGPHSPKGVEHGMSAELAAVADRVTAFGDHAATSVTTVSALLAAPLTEVGAPVLPPEPSAAMAAMCVAMLLSLAVALGLRVLSRARRGAVALPPVSTRMRARELTRAPPRDRLTRLCVLRT